MVADGCWMNQNQSIGNSKEHHSLSVSLCLCVCRSLSGCLPVSLSLSLPLFISLSIYIYKCVFFLLCCEVVKTVCRPTDRLTNGFSIQSGIQNRRQLT